MLVSHPAPVAIHKPNVAAIASLTPDSRNVDLHVRVVSTQLSLHRTRWNCEKSVIAEVLVADRSGSLLLTLRDEQAQLARPGTWLYIRNGRIEMHGGYIRMLVDRQRWSTIEAVASADEPTDEICTDAEKNISSVQFQLVSMPA